MANRRTCHCGIEVLNKPDHIDRLWRFRILRQCGVHGWLVKNSG